MGDEDASGLAEENYFLMRGVHPLIRSLKVSLI